MELITILNRCYRHKHFIYANANFSKSTPNEIEVQIVARKNSKPTCSKCHQQAPGYDHLPGRRFEFIPFWGFAIFLMYARRRVNCNRCGIIAEHIP